VSETRTLGVQAAREQLRDRIDAALEKDEHTVITRSGRPVAVLVPYRWWQERVEDGGDG
jgi:prevent-host-death family protein